MSNQSDFLPFVQTLLPLGSVLLGAWLANKNFQKQKISEKESIVDNVFLEIADARDQLKKAIPVMYRSYQSSRNLMAGDLEGLRLADKIYFNITRDALQKIYGDIEKNKRNDIKSIVHYSYHLDSGYESLLKEFMSKDSPLIYRNPGQMLAFSEIIMSYIIILSITYYLCNSLTERKETYRSEGIPVAEMVNKVWESLGIKDRIS